MTFGLHPRGHYESAPCTYHWRKPTHISFAAIGIRLSVPTTTQLLIYSPVASSDGALSGPLGAAVIGAPRVASPRWGIPSHITP